MHEHRLICPEMRDVAKSKALFAAWLAGKGITTTGIHYQQIPRKGLGIVAQRRLEVPQPPQHGLR